MSRIFFSARVALIRVKIANLFSYIFLKNHNIDPLVSLSQGAVDQYDCIYVKPQTGLSKYKFEIQYDRCGSRPDLNGKFYENNIVIQVPASRAR
jgi:hypothetical protein